MPTEPTETDTTASDATTSDTELPGTAYLWSGGPFGALGQFGALGPFGPLGPYGPVHWVRPIIKTGYEGFKDSMEASLACLDRKDRSLGPLGPLGPAGPLGPLALGPVASPHIDILREEEYRAYLDGTSYIVGSVATAEQGTVYDHGDDFEDIYDIKLDQKDTISRRKSGTIAAGRLLEDGTFALLSTQSCGTNFVDTGARGRVRPERIYTVLSRF